jgi:AcrR family transcriptional regulator
MSKSRMSTRAYIQEDRLSSGGKRRRNSTATSADLVAAARLLFSQHAYEAVTVRQIAATVGVNQALISRYFGSKRELFVAATEGIFLDTTWFEGDRKAFGLRLAAYIASKKRSDSDVDPLLFLVRSVGDTEAAEILRTAVDAQFIGPMAEWLGGPRAFVRAGVLTSLIIGAAVLRQVIRSRSLATSDREAVIASLARALQQVVNDDGQGRD